MTVEQLVPIIDFEPFLKGTDLERMAVAKQVLEAFQTIGFIYLRGHGIPQSTIDLAFEWSKKFFDLPAVEKDKLSWTVPESNRGFRKK
jgi:isopenicillin N synthase-like dioxygenase